MDFDSVLPDIGEYGRYQKLMLCFVLLPGILPCGFHAYNQLFMGLVPQHWCFLPEVVQLNCSADTRRRLSGRCHMYDVDYGRLVEDFRQRTDGDRTNVTSGGLPWTPNASWPTVPCRHGWEYRLDEAASSVVSDWDLVCKRSYLVPLSLSIFAAGGLVGNLIFGYVQDSLGRRPSFFIYLLILSVFGTATAFATDYLTWTVLRFFNGLAVPAIIGTPYVLAVELVGPSKRSQMTVITNIVYSLILVLLSIVASLVREWHQLALATTVPFVAFFLYWWVLPESPRWLLAHGKFEETEKIIRTIAHVNHKALPPDYMLTLKRRFQVENSIKDRDELLLRVYNFYDLFRTPNIRRKTITITFIWFATSCVYVGLSYSAPLLKGEPRFNFFVAALAELPSYILLWPSMELWGRKWTLCWSLVLSGSACIATMIVQEDDAFVLAFYAVGKFGISAAFTVLPLMASELYPTVIRGIGLNFSSFVSMLGPVLVPFVNYMGEKMLTFPLVCMGCLLLVAGFGSLSLPETLNQRLPQTLRDGEEMGKDVSFWEWFRCCPYKHSFIVEPSIQGDDDEAFDEDRGESPLKSLLEQQGILQSLISSDNEGTTNNSGDERSSKKVMVTAF